jgi:conjugal transfer/entry exclusion protein
LEDFVPNKNYTRKGISIWTAARRQLEKLQVMTKFDEKKAKEYKNLIETLKHYNDTEYYQNGELVKAIEKAKKL